MKMLYKSFDGEIFDNRTDCLRHEAIQFSRISGIDWYDDEVDIINLDGNLNQVDGSLLDLRYCDYVIAHNERNFKALKNYFYDKWNEILPEPDKTNKDYRFVFYDKWLNVKQAKDKAKAHLKIAQEKLDKIEKFEKM